MTTFPTLSRRLLIGQAVISTSQTPFKGLLQGFHPPPQRFAHTAHATMQQEHLQQQALGILDGVYGAWSPDWHPKPFERVAPRYLWTDAFGVCAYLSLFHATQEDKYLQQAIALVQAVHGTLGHERPKSGASSSSSSSSLPWLHGANAEHPTRAGLRIGKPHPEGHPDGDGQYYHYLTKWAFALHQVAAATHDARYLQWAIELMQTAHEAFTYKTSSGLRRMYWKMSIDLSQPAVASMGNLDPYDGLVTCTLLQQAAAKFPVAGDVQGSAAAGFDQGSGSKVLQAEIEDLQAMVEARYKSYHSDDPLDLGEALWLSHWQLGTAQSAAEAPGHPTGSPWANHVSGVSLASLEELWTEGYFQQPLRWRLGFREFGTSIGLQALLAVRPEMPRADVWRQRVQEIHETWSDQLSTRDRDITPVMFATSLIPGVWIRGNN